MPWWMPLEDKRAGPGAREDVLTLSLFRYFEYHLLELGFEMICMLNVDTILSSRT